MVKYHKQQKLLLIRLTIVVIVTVISVLAMAVVKDWINRDEALRAMNELSVAIKNYKKANGAVPPQSYVDKIREELQGDPRLGKLYYRARWINYQSKPDEILAYVEKNYRTVVLKPGAIVIRLDGRVEWMEQKEFRKLLASQQSLTEIKLTEP